MSGLSGSKVALKESFEEDDGSDDVEDEVFIRDGRGGYKVDEDVGIKRPLMAPRRKGKTSSPYHLEPRRSKWSCCKAVYCYILAATLALMGLFIATSVLLKMYPSSLQKIRQWTLPKKINDLVPVSCNDFSTKEIWSQSFPKFKSEASIAVANLNGDDVNDVVLGFSTGLEERSMPESCSGYPGSSGRCGGGALALDGKTGATLWQFWTRKDVLFVDCSANVNVDKTHDCLLSGKGGVLCIVDGKTGTMIWELAKPSSTVRMDVYSAQFVVDLDGDGNQDILVAHTSDLIAHLLVLSGRNGQTIGHIDTPNKEAIFTVPRLLVSLDGNYLVVFATGSLDSSGFLYIVPLHSIAQSDSSKCVKIWSYSSGVSSGILLADMDNDEIDDIIITSGDKLTVIDGKQYQVLWNISADMSNNPSQILTGPTPAFFNDDSTPDLLLTHMIGPSFPTYYYSQSWVADGKRGSNLLDNQMMGGGQIPAPGISVSYTGKGNDMFLYWLPTCNQHPSIQMASFSFAQGSSIHEQTHADQCMLRFNTTSEVRLYLLSQHNQPPGYMVYSSSDQVLPKLNLTKPRVQVSSGEERVEDNATPVKPSSFRHRVQQAKHHFQHGTGELLDPLDSPRFPEEPYPGTWEGPPPDSYADAIARIPEITLGEQAIDYESMYPQERQNEDLPPPDMSDGRDELMPPEVQPRRRREVTPTYLPRASSSASLDAPISNSGIDIVFALHWETPASNVRIKTPKDELCIRTKIAAARNNPNTLGNIEPELLTDTAERECLGIEDLPTDSPQPVLLTIRRVNIACSCPLLKNMETCSKPLPIRDQSFPRRAVGVYFKTKRPS